MLGLRPADVILIDEGVEIFSVAEELRFAEPSPAVLRFDYGFSFELGLDSDGLLGDRPVRVIETMTALIDHTEVVALGLAKLLI